MDSVIAKLDDSVFGMLVEQAPHIMVSGIQSRAEAEFVDTVRPDFACFDKGLSEEERKLLKEELSPAVRLLGSADDLPVISGVSDARALYAGPDISPEELKKNIRQQRPDTVVIELKQHSSSELDAVRALIRAVRKLQPAAAD